jgi:hypothetical protein
MKKITITTLVLVWILSLTVLIVALTEIYPDNIFKDYRLLVGVGFILITGLLRIAIKKVVKTG